MTVRQSTRERSGDGKREALVAAAIAVIARDGIKAATTRRIAEEAGLPLGTVHYWFAGKDELLREVVRAVLSKLNQAIEGSNPHPPTKSDELLSALRAAWGAVESDDPGAQLALYELTALSIRTPALRELARDQYEMYRETAAHTSSAWLEATGTELPGGPEALAQLVAVLFDGMTIAWLADPERARPDDVFRLVAHLLACAAGEPGAGRRTGSR